MVKVPARYDVEALLEERCNLENRNREYRVRWTQWPASHDAWVITSKLTCDMIIDYYVLDQYRVGKVDCNPASHRSSRARFVQPSHGKCAA